MSDNSKLITLWKASLIPLYTCLPALTWILHDYLVTVEDEIRYIWSQPNGTAKYMFFWIRYYTIALIMFDVTQIHLFARPGITNDNLCVAMDSIIRVVGAISLWSVEIIMQLRVYALYKCSKIVAAVNGFFFLASIAGFFYILAYNAERRRAVIASAIDLPLPGCPSIHSGIEWAQWVPATIFEGVLFFFALYKSLQTVAARARHGKSLSLYSLVIRDNLLYFFGVTCLLVFNNLMVVSVTKIPWFGYSPFHAAIGIMTCRMLMNLRKAATSEVSVSGGTSIMMKSRTRANTGTMGNTTLAGEGWQVAARPTSSFNPPTMGSTYDPGYDDHIVDIGREKPWPSLPSGRRDYEYPPGAAI